MPLMPLRDSDPNRIGRRRLIARLGSGGMGVVYLADAPDGGRVAIKVLRPELSDDADFRARFRREVAALGRVSGICTVRVIDADVDAAQPYLVTEYAAGPTLAEWAAEDGPLGREMLFSLAAGLAEALAAIHAAGVVHRDLKPGNVLLTADGPKVIDFGIAQTLDATSVTRTGMSIGSPGFMAPEQVRGKSGAAADVFAWGLTVAYAASGQPPFGTGPADVIFYRILHDDPDIEAVPEPLRPLVSAALAKNPGDRPTARDLLSSLAALPGVVPAASGAGPEGTGPQGAGPEGAGSGGAGSGAALRGMLARTWMVPARRLPDATVLRPSRRRNPFLLPSAGVAAILIVAGVVLAVGPGQHAAPAIARPSPTGPSCPPFSSLDACRYQTPVPVYTAGPLPTAVGTTQVTTPEPMGTTPYATVSGDPTTYSGGAGPASLWLEQMGWQPLNDGPGWGEAWGSLNVILARKSGPNGGIEAFFFDASTPVGADVPDDTGSTSVQAYRINQDTIDIRYTLEKAPSNTADVPFRLKDGHVLMLGSLPAAEFRHW